MLSSPTSPWGPLDNPNKKPSPEVTASPATPSPSVAPANYKATAAAAAPKIQPKAQSVPPAKPSAPLKQTPISAAVEQAQQSRLTNNTTSAELPTLSANQRKEINLLCAHHGIDLDSDFLEVLATCQSSSDMNAVLRDNLLVQDPQSIDAFVEDFWDLVQNPFKPVKKGVSNTTGAKPGNKKRGSKRR
eukprot:Gregarina_sp_Poly_1__9739@NODE_61_length_16710_cov_172_464520_g52_i0_p9_GENE_NODE_61_length_16710_cov_172_464520_g52_i0NODE_61_length_16710_cov_172_464520_g52_i0_p9_ORF_typecomplete_len188_score28_83R3H/PF01424_22/0_11_NODE_61_length_16710_cov_172_464520_g52_i038654428